MSDSKPSVPFPPAVVAADAPQRAKRSTYPEPFASRMQGREKRALGDLFGLTRFGVNLTRLAPGAISALKHAHVLRAIGQVGAGNLLGLAVFIALPSVILTLIYGQTRIFIAMSRDGLPPPALNRVHPRFRTPHVVTLMTGLAVVLGAAFFPVGQLADISNSGTLFAFLVVSLAVMMLRRTAPERPRPFRMPPVWLVGPASVIGCAVLFFYLPLAAQLVFPAWGGIGLAVYLGYGRRSPLRR